MFEFIDKTSEKKGTPINRMAMMALQGFLTKSIIFNDDGSIVEINENGETLTTVFNDDGSITLTFKGEKTISKDIYMNNDGSISEVVR